ncbi:hypothetical protein OEZ85_001913 [Tetradesmus obliquus]|uniref:CBM20 domain-containing protein n=1 Tax=Tetradesmus obliquus TaxID=3088 RepID=A0ABY8U1A6_TETOB|nr:hypothetical protein OEZ85_001913 [Tetradesmus obliquus]
MQAFNRRGVTANFTSTATATAAIPTPVKQAPFQLTRSNDSVTFIPASSSIAIGGKFNQLQLPNGVSVKAKARMWQDASGRVLFEAVAVNSWPAKSTLWDRTYARVDGVEVRPYVQYLLGSGTQLSFEPVQRGPAVGFELAYEEPQVEEDLEAMMVNFGRQSIWDEWVPQQPTLGRLEVPREQQSWAHADAAWERHRTPRHAK